MKRYRYITLSLLLLLLSLSTLSAQKRYTLRDKQGRYEFEVETTPSYCEKEGTLSVRLVKAVAATSPQLNQIKQVEYNVKDKSNGSYTNNNYVVASTPDAALLVQSLPGREDYEIYVKITMYENLHKAPIETQLVGKIVVENKYVPLVLMKEEFDPYRLSCRPYGGFHITVQGSEERPPVLTFEDAPTTFTGAKTMQPTRKEIKDGALLYHFEYKGVLPQGTYRYRFTNDCMSTEAKTFTVYGPKPDLPTVPQDLTMRFGIYVMSAEGCGEGITQLGSLSSDKLVLRTLFEAINKGYQGDPNKPYPEYLDSFPSTFKKNYEVAVITQLEYEELKKGSLNVDNLLWSDQTGSPTSISISGGSAEPGISYRLPQAMSIQELEAQKAFPGALLIRIKRPNTGCNDYITIPIKMNLNYVGGGKSGGGRFQILKTESTLDCSIGQIVWFEGWNFCSLYIKYYELPAGDNEPASGAQPVHTSKNFGPAVSTAVDKRYTFDGFDAKKRYYVELDVIDLYGKPVTPKPHLIIEPTNEEPIKNRLYDFGSIYTTVLQPLPDVSNSYWYELLTDPASYIKLYTTKATSLNALAGMEITLVQAPEGYEEYRNISEGHYYRVPDESNRYNPYGGGMIRLGETVKMSASFTGDGSSLPYAFYPFFFLYKMGENGERVVYSFKRGQRNNPVVLKDRFTGSIITPDEDDLKAEEYLKKHPMPRGVYRFKFEHPCQPGDFFYIDIDVNGPDYFKPILTEPLEPVVDYSSCDEVRVYPFADKRLDYGVDKNGRPRNMVFRVKGRTEADKELYFFPYDRKDNPIDHTKFYIPIKKTDLPRTISFDYKYLVPDHRWVRHEKPSYNATSVDPVGLDVFVRVDSTREDNGYYLLPLESYNPADDQVDWGKDGAFTFNASGEAESRWELMDFKPAVTVPVEIKRETPSPSYIRPTYVGYRCSPDMGYMEFKLINIPNGAGAVRLKDGATVIKSTNISTLTDMMVKWDLNATPGRELKKEYTLEIETTNCSDEGANTQKNFFKVHLLDTSEGLEVTLLPRRGVCPGEKVTLTATNLGVPDANYKWKVIDASGNEVKLEPATGRTVTCKVVAPRVVGSEVRYNTYKLTVTGTKCSRDFTADGIIPVSPDELWWMPDLNGEGHGTVPGGTGKEEKPSDPPHSDAQYYDWHNPDNWAFLHEGKFYPAKAVPTRCTNVHIMNMDQFKIGPAQSKLWAQPDLAKEVTPRDLYGEPTCIDITFHSGASVFNIQQLNYRRAMVRYNFGVADGTEYKSDRRIYTTEDCNTDEWLYGRNALNLLSAPLYDIYAGDYSFSASPYTYQLGFKTERAGKSIAAQFDASAFNDPSPLQSISMAGNNNSIALIVAGDEQGFKSREGKSAIVERRGILELPYFDRPDVAKPFYHQTYDASTGQTRFQYFDGKAKRFRGYYSDAQRTKMAYRFIFEDPATQRISKLADGTEVYTMDVSATAAGQEVMVGNPFMAPLEVVPFLEANKEVIEPYVRLLHSVDVKGYEPLNLDGKVTTCHQATAKDKKINPLGAFVVKFKSDVGPEAKLVFPTTALDSYAKQHPQSSSSLRNTSGDATAETARYLSLTLQSRLGKDRALVVYGYESGSVDKMLLSTESRYPSIAIVDPADGLHKDLYADDAATGHYELATQVSEPIDVTLSLAGSVMGHVVTARLIDYKSGMEHDLMGGKSCQIKLFPDDAEGRLELRVDGDFTSVAPMVEPTDELQAQYSEGMLTVRTAQEMSSLRLVQGDGITVYTQSLPGLTEYSERILLSSGSYVVEAIGTDGVARRAMLVVK